MIILLDAVQNQQCITIDVCYGKNYTHHITKNYTILVYLLGRKKEKIWSGSRIHWEVKCNVGGHQSQNETTQ